MFKKPICPMGHDKRIVGVCCDNYCRACRNERQNEKKRWRLRARGIPARNYAYLPALRYWRIEAELTQMELARLAGLSRGAIQEIENQRERSTLTTRQRIAAVLAVKPGVLVMQPPAEPKRRRVYRAAA